MYPFPRTRLSVVLAVRSADPEVRGRAFDGLVVAYWRPMYKYLRRRWRVSREDAEDLVQGFFARALEKGFFERYEPEKARFRTYVRLCLDGHAANEKKAANRQKRGGGVPLLPLDFESAEGELLHHDVASELDPEMYFHREWVRNLFTLAVEELRDRCEAEGKSVHFAIFERYDLDVEEAREPPTYAGLAAQFGLPVTQVTNHLAFARREFRQVVLDRLREITGSDAEFRDEALQLLGVEPP
jgi:RNA polymerase sigma factor (sigma-70 family)